MGWKLRKAALESTGMRARQQPMSHERIIALIGMCRYRETLKRVMLASGLDSSLKAWP
jgi:hypothetical protein